jgi:hypothetical protein
MRVLPLRAAHVKRWPTRKRNRDGNVGMGTLVRK